MNAQKPVLSREAVRHILGIPPDEPDDRAFEFMIRWQAMRVSKAYGNLVLKIQNGKEVHAEQNSPF
jgi:hypothetical protein